MLIPWSSLVLWVWNRVQCRSHPYWRLRCCVSVQAGAGRIPVHYWLVQFLRVTLHTYSRGWKGVDPSQPWDTQASPDPISFYGFVWLRFCFRFSTFFNSHPTKFSIFNLAWLNENLLLYTPLFHLLFIPPGGNSLSAITTVLYYVLCTVYYLVCTMYYVLYTFYICIR